MYMLTLTIFGPCLCCVVIGGCSSSSLFVVHFCPPGGVYYLPRSCNALRVASSVIDRCGALHCSAAGVWFSRHVDRTLRTLEYSIYRTLTTLEYTIYIYRTLTTLE